MRKSVKRLMPGLMLFAIATLVGAAVSGQTSRKTAVPKSAEATQEATRKATPKQVEDGVLKTLKFIQANGDPCVLPI